MKPAHLLAGIISVALTAECRPLAAQSSNRPPGLEEMQKRVAMDSNDAALHLGRLLLEKNRHDEAERHFRQAVAIAPGRAEAYLGLSAVPYVRGDNYWKQREKEQGREVVAKAWAESNKFQRLAFLIDPLVDPGFLPRVEERVTLRVDGMNYRVWWMLPLTKAAPR